jgi:hypothetical protein
LEIPGAMGFHFYCIPTSQELRREWVRLRRLWTRPPPVPQANALIDQKQGKIDNLLHFLHLRSGQSMKRRMAKSTTRPLQAIILVLAIVCDLFGQTPATTWIGTWKLNLGKSNIGVPIALGPTLKIVSQTLKVEESGGKLKLVGDTVLSDGNSSREEFNLDLDGKETVLADRTTSSKRINANSFEIIVKVANNVANGVGMNHFEFSADGKILIETKVQTKRGIVPAGTDPAKGVLIGTSTSVLVFDKVF